ncbi:MAG: hypothetical protein WDA16_05925 [Candidatus Thermoplasmatota archaeon]
MRDRLLEDLEQTFRIERTRSGPGKDRPHIGSSRGSPSESGVGLDRSAEGLLRALGALVLDIREHVHATLPRADDKDFSVLKQRVNGDKTSDAPTGRLALDAAGGANDKAELHVQMQEGFVGHVTGVSVRSTNPAFDAKDLSVTITLRGANLALSRIHFARPHVLELNDEVVLKIQNFSAAALNVEYAVEGWLRREG